MKDEDIIGQEFEGVMFKDLGILYYGGHHSEFLGKTGIVLGTHYKLPYCKVKFKVNDGVSTELWYPTEVVREQIQNKVPIDLNQLFNQIKSL